MARKQMHVQEHTSDTRTGAHQPHARINEHFDVQTNERARRHAKFLSNWRAARITHCRARGRAIARMRGRGTNATRNFAHKLADGVDGVGVFVIVIYEVPDFAQAFVHQKHARVEIFHKSLAADHCHIRNQDRFKTSAAPPGNKEANFAHNQDVVFREVVR
jgi:hypothetical protein